MNNNLAWICILFVQNSLGAAIRNHGHAIIYLLSCESDVVSFCLYGMTFINQMRCKLNLCGGKTN
jgi:hypothetical protein